MAPSVGTNTGHMVCFTSGLYLVSFMGKCAELLRYKMRNLQTVPLNWKIDHKCDSKVNYLQGKYTFFLKILQKNIISLFTARPIKYVIHSIFLFQDDYIPFLNEDLHLDNNSKRLILKKQETLLGTIILVCLKAFKYLMSFFTLEKKLYRWTSIMYFFIYFGTTVAATTVQPFGILYPL